MFTHCTAPVVQPFKVKQQMYTSEGNGVEASITVTAQAPFRGGGESFCGHAVSYFIKAHTVPLLQ